MFEAGVFGRNWNWDELDFTIPTNERVDCYLVEHKLAKKGVPIDKESKLIASRKTKIANWLEQLPIEWRDMSREAKEIMFALNTFIRGSYRVGSTNDESQDDFVPSQIRKQMLPDEPAST